MTALSHSSSLMSLKFMQKPLNKQGSGSIQTVKHDENQWRLPDKQIQKVNDVEIDTKSQSQGHRSFGGFNQTLEDFINRGSIGEMDVKEECVSVSGEDMFNYFNKQQKQKPVYSQINPSPEIKKVKRDHSTKMKKPKSESQTDRSTTPKRIHFKEFHDKPRDKKFRRN
ncbi:hypothetical protein BLNAU_16145 [Blattamonas nauphoetae]|uniref:Uncharacterized protein n=1 Tax=Blattamonas nauphoetae TaxID=2049346 RepID=A0ABQ9XE42_9EUKA|nr:hypothetical protein BLNAU_16145 [Blattamonas nauphoetae]